MKESQKILKHTRYPGSLLFYKHLKAQGCQASTVNVVTITNLNALQPTGHIQGWRGSFHFQWLQVVPSTFCFADFELPAMSCWTLRNAIMGDKRQDCRWFFSIFKLFTFFLIPNKIYLWIYNLPHHSINYSCSIKLKDVQMTRFKELLKYWGFLFGLFYLFIFGALYFCDTLFFHCFSLSTEPKVCIICFLQLFYLFFTHMGLLCSQW